MDRKTFLQTASALTGGIIISDMIACKPSQKSSTMNEHLTNWAGNLTYSTGNVHYPKTVGEVQEVVRKCNKIRALGLKPILKCGILSYHGPGMPI
ncbi:MAG TPA: hypothetical protein VGG71_09450 [Chitinophagaceae bacterium]